MLLLEFLEKKNVHTSLMELLVELSHATEEISTSIIQASTKKAGSINASGEEQIAMDILANDILVRYVKTNPYVAGYCSEEINGFEKVVGEGLYSVFFDPLDGSSLFDVNFSVGTIIGIYEGIDVLGRTPRGQVAALYAVYGPRTTIMLTIGQGVHEFLFTEDGWELLNEDVRLSGTKKYFAPGNLRATQEREDYLELVNWYMKEQYTLRYSGGMVPDINHIFKKGSGIFIYPGMPSAPDGKLRLLYECGPMAFLMEQAGGAGSNGECSILDVEIREYHQRTPIFLGKKEEVARCEKALKSI
ncbi:MAG: class 1 fructose-bisphosphatase [Candidatus Gracilibacteria bacterium]